MKIGVREGNLATPTRMDGFTKKSEATKRSEHGEMGLE